MNWDHIWEAVHETVAECQGQGKVASYIPALAAIDPKKFGIAVALGSGELRHSGDAEEPFSIQSISKIFTLSLALQAVGDELWRRVGREPSGSPFNSIVQLESERGIPRNPLINAGAIATTDHMVARSTADQVIADLLKLLRRLSNDPSVAVDQAVAQSESDKGSRNRALAHFMAAFGNMEGAVEESLSAYFRHCAIAMSCKQLARAALFLAFDGCDPITGEQVVTSRRCRRINAVMMASGHYDVSGDFAYRIGLPGKSGVGGGILTIAPNHGVIAVWSPALNASGTSMAGSKALETIAQRTGWSVFG